MRPERFRRAEEIFHRALDAEGGERERLLDEACAGDGELRRLVERMFARDPGPVDLEERVPLVVRAGEDGVVGSALGAWRITSKLAEGGMGVVYRARRADGLFDQEVAVKLLRVEAASAEALRRFALERQLLARLEHPNIARLLDGGATESGRPYLVMELVDGRPIDRFCDEQRLSLDERLRLFAEVCHAVHFAHTNLVVHRDLKPSNVLVDRHGTPKLLDFGIARLASESDSQPTLTAARLLTPQYASPEQLKGLRITTATDVYSLGVVLYELLTGRRPWSETGRTPAEWERIVSERTPTRPSTAILRSDVVDAPLRTAAEFADHLRSTPARLRRRLRGDLDTIVLMALRKEPERRYASAEQLAEDVERFLAGETVRARKDTFTYRTQRFVRRHRTAVASAALVAVALCAALYASWRGRLEAESAAEHARIETDSFRLIAQFLGDTFLESSSLDEERERVVRSMDAHVARVRRQYANQPHLRANLLDALGHVYARVDELDRAEELLREAQDIRLHEFGPDHLESALSLASLGRLHHRRGDHAAAAETFAAVLELHRRLPGEVHTDVATAANDLAVAHRNLGRAQDARRLHEEALALRRAGSPDGLPVAESLNNLALVLLDLGEIEEAAERLREAAEIRRALLGAEHALTLQVLVNLAGVEWRRGDLDAAEPRLAEAADGFRALGAEGRDGLLHALSNLAAVHVARGELDAAERSANDALEIARAIHGPDHPEVAVVSTRLAAIHAQRGDVERGRSAWEEVLRLRCASYPREHPLVANALASFGGFLLHAADSPAEAEPLLREALEVQQSLAPPDESALATAELLLGTCLQRLGRTEDARPLLQAAAERFERVEGADSKGTRTARERLASLPG